MPVDADVQFLFCTFRGEAMIALFKQGRFTRRVRAAMLCALAPLALGFGPAAHAIYKGTEDPAGLYSGVGMILPTSTHAACTGTMLTGTVFLTAAQCVYDQTPGADFLFSLGTGMTAHATEIRAHPGFNTPDGLSLPYDIALVALDKSDVASWSGFTQWSIGTAVPVSSAVTAVGFGENDHGSGSGVRRSGNLSVTQYIGAEGPPGVFIPDAFIETNPADSLGQVFCPGDAGGPLLRNHAIVGIASFRFVAACDEAGPGYYLNLQNFADWITTNLGAMDPAVPVPEPASIALLGMGIAALGLGRRKRNP
jgi:secreted trypsin-like serine protease